MAAKKAHPRDVTQTKKETEIIEPKKKQTNKLTSKKTIAAKARRLLAFYIEVTLPAKKSVMLVKKFIKISITT